MPELDTAIKKGLQSRPNGANGKRNGKNKGGRPTKAEKQKYTKEKSINSLSVFGEEIDSNAALANFRKLMQERKASEHIKRVKSGEYDNLI